MTLRKIGKLMKNGDAEFRAYTFDTTSFLAHAIAKSYLAQFCYDLMAAGTIIAYLVLTWVVGGWNHLWMHAAWLGMIAGIIVLGNLVPRFSHKDKVIYKAIRGFTLIEEITGKEIGSDPDAEVDVKKVVETIEQHLKLGGEWIAIKQEKEKGKPYAKRESVRDRKKFKFDLECLSLALEFTELPKNPGYYIKRREQEPVTA